jgi:hypothetical protein
MDAPPDEPDAAWAQFELDQPVEAIGRLLANPILVLRLNPLVTYERLESDAGGRLLMRARNDSNGLAIDTSATTSTDATIPALSFAFSSGIKRETRLQGETTATGSKLRITDVYGRPSDDGPQGQEAADRSLVPWTAALRRHLERDARWGRIPGYRWLAEVFWPSMTPGHRRIAWLLVWTTALESLVFLAVLAVYLQRR